VSFLSKIVKKVTSSDITKLAVRATAAYYSGGTSEMLLQARQALAGGGFAGVGDDLAAYAADQYPNVAAMVDQFRGYSKPSPRMVALPTPAYELPTPLSPEDYEEDQGDYEEDYYSDEEEE
jgi:hypothetical protein